MIPPPCFFCLESLDPTTPVLCVWCRHPTSSPHLLHPTEARGLGVCHTCMTRARITRPIQTPLPNPDLIPISTWKHLGMWGLIGTLGLQ